MYVGRSRCRPRPARRARSRRSAPAGCPPALRAPSMSVSSRSPTISGRSPPTRRTVSSSSGRSRLAGDHGLDARELREQPHQHAVPGPDAVRGRDVQVGVAGHPGQPGPDQDGGPHDLAPPDVRAVPLTTAAASSSTATGSRPSCSAPPPARDPSRTTCAPASSRSASTRAAACAVVTTSAGVGLDAQLAQVLGDPGGWRDALLVTKASASRPCEPGPGARGPPRTASRRRRPRRRGRAPRRRRPRTAVGPTPPSTRPTSRPGARHPEPTMLRWTPALRDPALGVAGPFRLEPFRAPDALATPGRRPGVGPGVRAGPTAT